MLSSFCSLSQDITLKKEIDIDNNEFVSVYLLPESKIHSEVNATVESSKHILSTQIFSFISYFRIVAQADNYITAVNSNVFFLVLLFNETIQPFLMSASYYIPQVTTSYSLSTITCGTFYVIGPATLTPYMPETNNMNRRYYTYSSLILNKDTRFVNGFFVGCSPFEAFLNSTLDCLYQTECLQLLTDFFPSIQQVCSITISIYLDFRKHLFLI